MKKVLALIVLLWITSVTAQEHPRTVVTLDGPQSNFAVSVNGKRPKDLLRTLSEIDPNNRNPEAFLLIHEKAPIDVVWNLLGIMSKAGMTNPTMFVYPKEKGVMQEMTLGCVMLYSPDASDLKPAHGREKCP
jgi:hypothetical protein